MNCQWHAFPNLFARDEVTASLLGGEFNQRDATAG
jgi:hypothetical protein